ncbi:tyrosine-protein kinase family protein [uncultured Eudoraea sp.]|uniref:GumC family protein n=1 Tax=uncultured Eudoraea sp. TaxID=1035614 RepID=UPI002617F8B3|nr:tyrosine-protein kinase family protein [uncultured Eudoraea sp.]
MKEAPFSLDFNDEEESFALKEIILKYLRHWPWFLGVTLVSMALAYVYTIYVPNTYETVAKIKMVDESMELNVASNGMAMLGRNSNINLDNEIEVLRSYRLLSQVGSDLNLNINTYRVETIKTIQIWDPPFVITAVREEALLGIPRAYTISLSPSKITISDEEDGIFNVSPDATDIPPEGLPFNIALNENTDADYEGTEFKVVIRPMKDAIMGLAEALEIDVTNRESDIVSLTLKGQSPERSEAILNAIIAKFNEDGILDRQLVSRRTMEVIDKRFVNLASELDSIEVGKQDFKQSNRLSYIEADAGITLQRKSEAEDQVTVLENQISLSKLLKETVINQAEYSLLPADIGLENSSLNSLVANYNELALERDKLLPNVGVNHPTLRSISGQLERGKVNIIKSVNVYQAQLRTSLSQLRRESSRAGAVFSELPEQEKMLRGIERQQSIKEQLFLLLLQKREEAAINMATTTPSIKVVDYGLTNSKPVFPKKIIIYPLSLALGMFLPFLVLFIKFSLDTKIHDRTDLEKLCPDIPVLAEIPFLKGAKSIKGLHDRSILAESFRMLSTSINHHLPEKEKDIGQVLYVTSAIKGEGKTLVAFNLALAYASLKKRVLLVGADLRNPQLHTYLDILKKAKGLSEYLSNPSMNWQDVINEGFSDELNIKVCYSRQMPPNAPELLSGKGFEKFINAAKEEFDYIIVDTAPTLLVTDTMLISKAADLTLFVTRAGFTDKKLLEYSKNLNKSKKLQNMAYALNDVGFGKARHYNYGYGYGYGSEKK